VQKALERVRINVQLIDATTGGHVWAERYDRELQDIFALQDDIAQKIVFVLKVKLAPEEQARFRRHPTENLEAYEFLLRGLQHFSASTTQEVNAQARQMFTHALERDPQYAAAYAFLGWSYWQDWLNLWDLNPQTLARAQELGQQALSLDSSLSSAHACLGIVALYQRQYEQTMKATEQAIALDPNYALAYWVKAEILNYVGKPEEAIEVGTKALRLNPFDQIPYLAQLGWAQRLAGRYQESLATVKKVRVLAPTQWWVHYELAILYSDLGRDAEAQAEVVELLRLNSDVSLQALRQGTAYKDPALLEHDLAALRKAGMK
jgi:tetratricopeptide (TPR) repeat protein